MYRVQLPEGKVVVLEDLSQFVGILLNMPAGAIVHTVVDAEGVLIVLQNFKPSPTAISPKS